MIQFYNKYYFVKPLRVGKRNTDFEIYDNNGKLLGTNAEPLIDASYFDNNSQLYDEFFDTIDKECEKIEAKLKFEKEFGTPIQSFDKGELENRFLEFSLIMKLKWGIEENLLRAVM